MTLRRSGFASWLAVALICLSGACRQQDATREGPPTAAASRSTTQMDDPPNIAPTIAASQRPVARNPAAASPHQAPPDPTTSASAGEPAPLITRQIFWPNGQLRHECTVKVGPHGKDIRHGHAVSWHQNGQMYLSGHYEDGKQSGSWPSWHPNGQLRGRGQFVDGLKDGVWTLWDEQGRKRREWSNERDLMHGPFTEWDEAGNVVESGEYEHGRKHGPWRERTADGPVDVRYDNGTRLP